MEGDTCGRGEAQAGLPPEHFCLLSFLYQMAPCHFLPDHSLPGNAPAFFTSLINSAPSLHSSTGHWSSACVPTGFSLHLSGASSCCWWRPHYGVQCSWKGREGNCNGKSSQGSCTWKKKKTLKLEECVINWYNAKWQLIFICGRVRVV